VAPTTVPPHIPTPELSETASPTTESIKEGAALLGEPMLSVAPVEGDQRWTWVEAAAEAWLANRAVAEPTKVDEPEPGEQDADETPIEAPLLESPASEKTGGERRGPGRD
jgi:hypothetical protein